jgi:hypothetical protein
LNRSRPWQCAVAFAIFLSFTSCVSKKSQPELVPKPEPLKLYDGITIEVQPTTTSLYDEDAMSEFIEDLEEFNICSKSDIRIVVRPTVIAFHRQWTSATVRLFERRFRRLWDTNKADKHLILHISLLPGQYVLPPKNNVIGIKYGRNQSIALFQGAFGRNLLFHELGHVIGLVDRCNREGDPVNPDRPNHCNTRRCSMFWTIHPRKAPRLDPLCERDIQELIEKGRSNGHVNRHNQFSTATPVCSSRPQKR